jgi:hypothetical protein
MPRVAALPLLLMLVSGCAYRTSEVWTKPGVADVDRQRDHRECLADAVDVTNAFWGPQGHYIHLDRGMYETCMTRRGYTLSSEQR